MASLRRRRDHIRFHGRSNHRSGANSTSGAGATTCASGRQPGSAKLASHPAECGNNRPVATMLGSGMSRSSFKSGGTTMVGPVVRFGGNRKIGCFGVRGVSRLCLRSLGGAGVERGQIFFRRIGHQRRPVKGGAIQNLLLPDPRNRDRIYEGKGGRCKTTDCRNRPQGNLCWTKTSCQRSGSPRRTAGAIPSAEQPALRSGTPGSPDRVPLQSHIFLPGDSISRSKSSSELISLLRRCPRQAGSGRLCGLATDGRFVARIMPTIGRPLIHDAWRDGWRRSRWPVTSSSAIL